MPPASPPPDPPKRRLGSPSETPKPSKTPRSLEEGREDDVEDEEAHRPAMNPRPGGTQRYLVAVEYVGSRFFGSQKQPDFRTVAGALEEAFRKFIGHPVSICFSSRTDAGVHALSNVCHVDVERISKKRPGEVLPPHEPGVVKRAVNHFLKKNEGDMAVIDVRCVPAEFHARYKALERTYFYRILSGPDPLSAFDIERAWHVPEELDLPAMKKACSILVGHHDFSSFRATGCQANSPIRTLDELHVAEVVPSPYFPSSAERGERELNSEPLSCTIKSEHESSTPHSVESHNDASSFPAKSGKEFGQRSRHRSYVITARARSFLYHQVRLMVGVLKCVGTGNLAASDVERILDAKTVTAASPIAPACGLYLGNVNYDLP